MSSWPVFRGKLVGALTFNPFLGPPQANVNVGKYFSKKKVDRFTSGIIAKFRHVTHPIFWTPPSVRVIRASSLTRPPPRWRVISACPPRPCPSQKPLKFYSHSLRSLEDTQKTMTGHLGLDTLPSASFCVISELITPRPVTWMNFKFSHVTHPIFGQPPTVHVIRASSLYISG